MAKEKNVKPVKSTPKTSTTNPNLGEIRGDNHNLPTFKNPPPPPSVKKDK